MLAQADRGSVDVLRVAIVVIVTPGPGKGAGIGGPAIVIDLGWRGGRFAVTLFTRLALLAAGLALTVDDA